MRPTSANITGLVGKTISLDPALTVRSSNVSSGLRNEEKSMTLTVTSGHVSLAAGTGPDSGLWVPYAEGEAVIGYAAEGQTWLASGPFSGCELAIGREKSGSKRIFGAHIAKQSGSNAVAAFKTAVDKLSIWYHNRIPMPVMGNSFACSYMFAEVGDSGIVSMTRMDVEVKSMGGSDGTIKSFHIFK